jgi:hypothetical protein
MKMIFVKSNVPAEHPLLLSHLGNKTGIYYIDSTALPVCDNHHISRHKVFAGLAQRGKTSMGWFFGFKLHLVFNNDNEIVASKLTELGRLRVAKRLSH